MDKKERGEKPITSEDIAKEKLSERLSLRKRKIHDILNTKRFRSIQGNQIISKYQVDIKKLKLPPNYFQVTNLKENFNSLVELFGCADMEVVKFAVASIRTITTEELQFENTFNLTWIRQLFYLMSQHLDCPDLIVSLFILIFYYSMNVYGF